MPTVIDATVVNSAYSTNGNGGRKLVKLSNGWFVSATVNGIIYFHVSKDNGLTWQLLCQSAAGSGYSDVSIVNVGTRVYALAIGQAISVNSYFNFDATTVGSTVTSIDLDTNQTSTNGFNGVSLAINESGTELHAAWASKNSSYPNSFNIRYAKGTINADGSVTWGAVEQVTKFNNSSYTYVDGLSVILFNNTPCILLGQPQSYLGGASVVNGSGGAISVLKRDNSLTTGNSQVDTNWTYKNVYVGGGYPQSYPSACVDKNGWIWVAWMGIDSIDNARYNIRVAYSDDGGQTWSVPTKLTSGNTYDYSSPSITVNKNNEVFVLFYGRDATDGYYDIRMIKYSSGSWGSISIVSNGTTSHKDMPSVLYDVTIDFSMPLFIYRDQGEKVGFCGTWVVNAISVTPGYIGQKSDKSNILTYSITTDGTMSDITEKINGVTIATRTNPTSGQEFTVSLTQEQWDAIQFGNGHTLTIEMNGETWTYTFDKRLNENDDILSAVKGVQDLQTHLNGIKEQLGAAIRAKGGTVNDTDAFTTMLSVLNGLATKKWASGTVTSSSSSISFQYAGNTSTYLLYFVTVTGLTFKPSTIILIETVSVTMSIYSEIYDGYYPKTVKVFSYSPTSVTNSVYNIKGDVSPAYVNDTGFCLPTYVGNRTYTWLAFE